MVTYLEGHLQGKGRKIGIVVARFNSFISERLLEGAIDSLVRSGVATEDIVVAHCTHALQRPVKWVAERSEEFLSASHGRDIRSQAELALDADGRVLGLRVHTQANVGAYATATGVVIQLLIGPWVTTSIYDIRTIDLKLQAVLTNTTPVGAYRGAGRPEAIYIIERLMDAAARQLDMDPAEIRRSAAAGTRQAASTRPDSAPISRIDNAAVAGPARLYCDGHVVMAWISRSSARPSTRRIAR